MWQLFLQAFLSICGIGEKQLWVLWCKIPECLNDKRGKRENQGNIISEEIKEKARHHFFQEYNSLAFTSDVSGSVRESKRHYVKLLR